MSLEIRALGAADVEAVHALLLAAAADEASGLARRPDEISADYVARFLDHATIRLGAFEAGRLLGEIHAVRMAPRQFQHVVTDLTVAVDPQSQGKGVGGALFEALFAAARAMTPPVERVELMVRAGHSRAIALYQRMGFAIEGRFPRRVRLPDGTVEDDLAMGKVLR